jgi:hypothetical protein
VLIEGRAYILLSDRDD